jgi:transposase InsO family protein
MNEGSQQVRSGVVQFKRLLKRKPDGVTERSASPRESRALPEQAQEFRRALTKHGLVGSTSAPANPYDNAQAESFMKTLKVEEVYLAGYETFEDVAARLPPFHRRRVQRQKNALVYRLTVTRCL